MNLRRLCQIILKSDKGISGYGQLAQHAIFAYHIVRQTPLIALLPLPFPVSNKAYLKLDFDCKNQTERYRISDSGAKWHFPEIAGSGTE